MSAAAYETKDSYIVSFAVDESESETAMNIFLDRKSVALRFVHYLNGGESCPEVEALLAQMD